MIRQIGKVSLAFLIALSMFLSPMISSNSAKAESVEDTARLELDENIVESGEDIAELDEDIAQEEEKVNLAVYKAVTSSSSYEKINEGWGAELLVDGDKTGPNPPGIANNGWTTLPAKGQPPEGSPAWVKIDLGAVFNTDQIVLWPRSDNGVNNIGLGFPVDFKVIASIDDENWTVLNTFADYPTPTTGQSLELNYDGTKTRFVKVEATKLQQDDRGQVVMQFREIEVFMANSNMTDQEIVDEDYEYLDIYPTQELVSSIKLPTIGPFGSTISWSSSDLDVVSHTGKVKRPQPGSPVAEVVLTATVRKGAVSRDKTFFVTVKPHKLREEQTEDEFLIGIFWPPTWEYTNDQQYQWIKEANVDILQNVLGSGLDTEERNMKMLDLAERYGLKVSVADPRIRGTDEEIKEVVETYKDYWATGGYYIRDEPGIGELSREAHIYKEVLRHDNTKNPYVNLFPNIYGKEYESGYVRAWIEEVGSENLRYLSYDNYPFLANDGFDNNYYDTADIIRRVGLEYDIKTASYLQSIGYGSSPSNVHHRTPSEADLRFSAYSYLAYGFKYVTWFTYWTPTNRGEYFEDAIIDPNGNKTVRYEPFKQINGEMKQLGKTLIKLDAVEVFHTGETMPTPSTKLLPDNFYVQPVNSNDEMIVSYMLHKENGKSYVMVVNKSLKEAKDFNLKVDSAVAGLKEISKIDGSELVANFNPETDILSDHFLPGEGRLYLLIGELPRYVSPQEPNVLPNPVLDIQHPLSNLALNKNTTASTDIHNWGWKKSNVVDGNKIGGTGDHDDKGWTSTPTKIHPTAPEWIMIDLGREYLVNQVDLWPRNDSGANIGIGFPIDYKVLVSNDMKNWTVAVQITDVAQPTDGKPAKHNFDTIPSQYVKIEASKMRQDPNKSFAFQLAEIEVYQEDPGTRLELQADTTDLLVGAQTELRISQWQDDGNLVKIQDAVVTSNDPSIITVDDQDDQWVIKAVGVGTAWIEVSVYSDDIVIDHTAIEVTVRSLEAPWKVTYLGDANGIIVPEPGTLDIRASGSGIGEGNDSFVFVHQPAQGRNHVLTGKIIYYGIPFLKWIKLCNVVYTKQPSVFSHVRFKAWP